jgi:uncharacterized protein Usg
MPMTLVTPIRDAEGFGVTTAQIVYRLPDRPEILQEFIWQKLDLFPIFPELQRFLSFWEREIEGRLHSITVAHARLIHPQELAKLGGEYRLH